MTGTSTASGSIGRQDEVEAVHEDLRRQILHNELKSGGRINQAVIARDLRVSRGPVREALRLLQREGLVEHVHQHQMRVSGLTLDDLEQLYSRRIVLEAYAVRATVPGLTDTELDALQVMMTRMDDAAAAKDPNRWEDAHNRFHTLLWGGVGGWIRGDLHDLAEHSARYRRIYLQDGTVAWADAKRDHVAIFDATISRDGVLASSCHGLHLGKAALAVAAIIDPSHEPAMLRTAIRMVSGG